jgi:hypothetical protein
VREREQGFRRNALERQKPTGATSVIGVNRVGWARDSRKGQSPGAAAGWSGPRIRPREQQPGERQAGSFAAETRRVPFERGKLRRAESQERCRHETGPVRARGE